MEKTKCELEQHIDMLIRDRERNTEKSTYAKSVKAQEVADMENKLQEEIARYENRSYWVNNHIPVLRK